MTEKYSIDKHLEWDKPCIDLKGYRWWITITKDEIEIEYECDEAGTHRIYLSTKDMRDILADFEGGKG